MSDFNLFEAHEASNEEGRLEAARAGDKLAAAISEVRSQFGPFLFQAADRGDFEDRVALCKDDMIRTVNAHVMPVTGTMRRVIRAVREDWEGRRPRVAADEVLVPEGDFHGYLDEVAPQAESKAGENFVVTGPVGEHDGDPADTDFAKQAGNEHGGFEWAEGYTPDEDDVRDRKKLKNPDGRLSPGESWGGRQSSRRQASGIDEFRARFTGIPTSQLVRDYEESDGDDDLFEELHYRMEENDREAAQAISNDYNVDDPDWTYQTGYDGDDVAEGIAPLARRRNAGYGAKSYDVAGYTYQGQNFEPADLIEYMVANGDLSPAARDMDPEEVLDQHAGASAIDRYDERSFDSGEFPKVIFNDQLDPEYDSDWYSGFREGRRVGAEYDHPGYEVPDHPGHSRHQDPDWVEQGMTAEEWNKAGRPGWKTNKESRRRQAGGDPLGTAVEAITQELQEQAELFQQQIEPLQQALQAVDYAQQVQQSQQPLNVTPGEGTVQVIPERNPVPEPVPTGGPQVMPEQAPPPADPNDPYGQAAQQQQVQARRRSARGRRPFGRSPVQARRRRAGTMPDGSDAPDEAESARYVLDFMRAKGVDTLRVDDENPNPSYQRDFDDEEELDDAVAWVPQELIYNGPRGDRDPWNPVLRRQDLEDYFNRQASRGRRRSAAGAKVVHNKMLGGWYVVSGPHDTPLSGKFDSKDEAHAWLNRKKSSRVGASIVDVVSNDPGHPMAFSCPQCGAAGLESCEDLGDGDSDYQDSGIHGKRKERAWKAYMGRKVRRQDDEESDAVRALRWQNSQTQGPRTGEDIGGGHLFGYDGENRHQARRGRRPLANDRRVAAGGSLNDVMEFGHPILVGPNGEVGDSDEYAPEVGYLNLDADGQSLDDEVEGLGDGWQLLKGFTGQQGYRGPVMHPSEFIGGGLERHIRENPGHYVAIPIDGLGPNEGDEPESVGWGVAYKPHTARRRSASQDCPDCGGDGCDWDTYPNKDGVAELCSTCKGSGSAPAKREGRRRSAAGDPTTAEDMPGWEQIHGRDLQPGDMAMVGRWFGKVRRVEPHASGKGVWVDLGGEDNRLMRLRGRTWRMLPETVERNFGREGRTSSRGRHPFGDRRRHAGTGELIDWMDAFGDTPSKQGDAVNAKLKELAGQGDELAAAWLAGDGNNPGRRRRHASDEEPEYDAGVPVYSAVQNDDGTHRVERWMDGETDIYEPQLSRVEALDLAEMSNQFAHEEPKGSRYINLGDDEFPNMQLVTVKHPRHPNNRTAARRGAARSVALIGGGNSHRPQGWEWDSHLLAFTAHAPQRFACSCGHDLDMPGYRRCVCGKVWNGYAIAKGGDTRTAQADTYLVREIPVRKDVILAGRRDRAIREANLRLAGEPVEGPLEWSKERGERGWVHRAESPFGPKYTIERDSYNPRRWLLRSFERSLRDDSVPHRTEGPARGSMTVENNHYTVDRAKAYAEDHHRRSVDRYRESHPFPTAGRMKDLWMEEREAAGEDPEFPWPSEVGQDAPKVGQPPVDWHRRDSGGKWTPPGVPGKKGGRR